ncbi:sensor histidine kinase [Aestuariispira insulae]|uniref:histidine kinase n=1 Tax=Aestuariispira insulae TaxID=1461337 RepID=A0A3D9HMS4_9PROT|nr:ATP-binding protein [Aestuariispira insulae]RED50800.1 signal transduction histidine kinase [Aestuariispira insulae]
MQNWLATVVDMIVPKSLARRMVFCGMICGAIAVTAVSWGMLQILERRVEVAEAARLGTTMAAIFRRLDAGQSIHAEAELDPEDLSFSLAGSVPLRNAQLSVKKLPGAGKRFPEITLLLERGTLRESLFAGTTTFASLETLMTDIAVGLAKHDRQAAVYLRLRDGSLLRFESRRYWADRTSETIWFLAILIIVTLCGCTFLILARALAHPYRAIATLPPGDDTALPATDWFWTREARSTLKTIQNERETRQEMLEERTRMLAAISHDLRTPATRIQLRADYIEDDELRAKILADLESMLGMIRDAIDFLKGSIIQEPMERLDFPSLVQSICDDYADTGAPVSFLEPQFMTVTTMGTVFGGFTREVELKDVLTGYISGQPVALGRVFDNLIGNAVKFGGQARVEMQVKPTEIIVEITDKGPGIPDEEFSNVFKPFYRLEKSRNRQTGGSGLGLSIAKSVIDLHHGMIDLLNLPQGGLLVRVILPRNIPNQEMPLE